MTDTPVKNNEEARLAGHAARFQARRDEHEVLKEKAIEPLIFERTKRSPMWQESTDLERNPVFTKRFTPALSVIEEEALKRVLINHHIVTADAFSTPQSDIALTRTVDTRLLSGITLSAAAFEKVREDMIAPTILRDQPDDVQGWELHRAGDPGKEQVNIYTKIFGEALGKKQPNGTTENTLFGSIVQASLEQLGLTRGKDFDWDTNGRGVITSHQAYTDMIAPALAALTRDSKSPRR